MNITVDEAIINQCNGKEIAVYIALRKYMNYMRKDAHPSIATLASILDWSENTVRKWLRSLEKKGIIMIEYRPLYKDGKKFNDTNVYHFLLERVLQKSKKSTSKVEDELNKKDMNDLEEEKNKLISKYGKDIFKKALKRLSNQIKAGNCIIDTFSYLRKICMNLKAQIDLVANVSADNVADRKGNNHKSATVQKTKIPTVRTSRDSGKNKFHNFFQRTSLYSSEELNKMLLSR